jgi:hypothetical protein
VLPITPRGNFGSANMRHYIEISKLQLLDNGKLVLYLHDNHGARCCFFHPGGYGKKWACLQIDQGFSDRLNERILQRISQSCFRRFTIQFIGLYLQSHNEILLCREFSFPLCDNNTRKAVANDIHCRSSHIQNFINPQNNCDSF